VTWNQLSWFAVPVKYEQVVFCGLSSFQLSLYRLFISSPEIKALLRGQNSQPLKAINILKKLCNHPELLDLPGDLHGSDHLIPEGFVGAGGNAGSGTSRDKGRNQAVRCDWGGKFVVLERYQFRLSDNISQLKGRVIGSCITSEPRPQTRLC
jgi:DNA repair and recombination protein RAD54 and RAD54-like protein